MPYYTFLYYLYILTSSLSKYDKIKTVGKWGIWTPTGVLVGYYPPTLGVGVWGSLDPLRGSRGSSCFITINYYKTLYKPHT